MRPSFTLLSTLLFFIWTASQAQTNNDCIISLGPDVTVCNNATFSLNPNGNPNGNYTWTGPAGLSCYNCPSPVVSGLTTGIYTFIGTIQTPQCTKSDTIKITVIPGQQPKYTIIDDKDICKGTTLSLGGAPYPSTFYQWTSEPPGYLSSQSNPIVTPTGTTQYFLIAFNTSCPFVSIDSVLITVVDPPVLDIQGDTAICNGESVTLGYSIPENGVSYVWTPNDGSLSSDTVANPVATPLQTTLYKLVATKSVCMEMRTVQVSVVNLNLTLSTGDTTHICQGASATIQATVDPPGGVISWSPLDDLQVNPGGLSAIASPASATLYSATVKVPGCIRTRSVYVVVDSLPADLHIFPGDTTICNGSQVLLNSNAYDSLAYPDITFQWFPSQGLVTTDSLYSVTVQPGATTTYLRVTSNGACVDSTTAIVRVTTPPDLHVEPGDTLVCIGKSVALKAVYSPGVTDILWSPPASLSCTQCDNTVATPSSTTTYTVSGNYKGCPVSASSIVSVKNLPIIQFPTDVQLCLGESLVLNEVADTGTYTWTSSDPNFTPTNNPQPTITPTQTATYFVQADNGCQNQGQVTVSVTSATLEASQDTTICKNFSATLTASGSVPGMFEWSTGQTGQAILVTPAQTTTYTVTYTYANNCKLTDQVTVTLQGVGPEIVFPNDLELCPGESITLNTAAATPGAVYSWTSSPQGFTSSLAKPSDTPNQTTKYTVTASLDDCKITKDVNVIVYNATLTLPPDVTICRGEEVSLAANGSLSGTYSWSSGDSTALINVSPSGTTTYDLLYTYGDGCTLEDMVKVTVKDNFSLKIVSDPDTNRINLGDPLSLMGIVSPSQNLSAFQFQWLENGTNTVGNTDAIDLVPSSNDSTITYDLIAISPNGCRQQVQAKFIIVLPLVVVPNAFTPNNDGVNDIFRMKILEGSAIVLSMEVYDRWGKKVFESKDPQPVWDGKSEGKDAPSDVYVYVIRWQRGDGALQPPLIGEVGLLR